MVMKKFTTTSLLFGLMQNYKAKRIAKFAKFDSSFILSLMIYLTGCKKQTENRKMAQWTSEYAILRDLSVAQGRVPVAIERTVGAGDKPPSLKITEETEEEFFKHSADANFSVAPDLGLIQKMLDMVRDVHEWSDDEDNTNKAVKISKLNPQCPEFIPKQRNTSTPNDGVPIKQINKPKKRQRNIALESILQAIADNNKRCDEVVLRKPNDFITNHGEAKLELADEPEIQEVLGGDNCISSSLTAAEKVNVWFETQTESPFPKKTSKVTLEAANIVFKKKEKLKKIDKCPKENLKRLERSPISSCSNSGEYKPSRLANEYYLKYIERSKFKESIRDDMWTKVEKKMKDLDNIRKFKAVQALPSSSASLVSELNQSFEDTQNTDAFTARIVAETKISRCLDLVALPQHRHRLTGNCIVCEVLTKKPNIPQTEIFEENDNEVTNNTDNVDSVNIETENAEINKEGLTGKEKIAVLINKELAKFVESENRKSIDIVETPDLFYEDCILQVEETESDSDTALDVQTLHKTELHFLEAGLSDKSF